MLRSVGLFSTDVSELRISPVLSGQTSSFLDTLTLEAGTDTQSWNADTKPIYDA
jgi:hypothetical protein